MDDKIKISFADSSADVNFLTDFFVENLNAFYISPQDMLCGRAIDPHNWSPNLREVLHTEIEGITQNKIENKKVFVVQSCDEIVSVGILSFERDLVTLEDIIVDNGKRGNGLGTIILQELFSMLKSLGAKGCILESGIQNESAHKFFMREGFHVVSKGLFKSLTL